MTIDISRFYQVYFDEAEELLAEMERLLLAVDVAAPDPEMLNAVFRSAHSIKGGAATFGVNDMAEVTHFLESLLDKIRIGEMVLTPEHVDAFLATKDVLKMLLDGHKIGSAVNHDSVADVRMMLQSMFENGAVAPPIPVAEMVESPVMSVRGKNRYQIDLPQLSERDQDALSGELRLMGHLDQVPTEGSGLCFYLDTDESADDISAVCAFIVSADEVKVSDAPSLTPEQQIQRAQDQEDDDQGYGFFAPFVPAGTGSVTDEQRGYGFFQSLSEIRTNAAQANSAVKSAKQIRASVAAASQEMSKAGDALNARRSSDQEASSIRVSIDKVDQLINLVGELVITQAMIEQRVETLDPMQHERLLSSVSQLTRNTRELQESVMSIRMMPMDFVFSRFPRMVRDLASKMGKRIEFVTNGAATELDKGLIERIIDPLTHLVRNSIDHGIETQEVRIAAGKSPVGKLLLAAGHQGGNIVIEITDDGAGLNREKILAKARQQGMPVSEAMRDEEIWQLIFAPGFSTAEVVTDVSGRGVGMDIVKKNITAMGGTVDLRSAVGFGTTITISLPLTLAILDGMSIKVGAEIYILPLGFVVESLQPAAEDIREISGKGKVVKVRGEYLPLVSLSAMFDIEAGCKEAEQGIIVILESDMHKVGLLVDELVGQQQVVVKNLEANYRRVHGISGATILGDGGVALIVDVAAITRSNHQGLVEMVDG